MLIRATFFFEQEGYGWTESWYRDAPALTTLAAFQDDTDLLAVKRAALNGKNTFLKFVRSSNTAVRMDRAIISYNGNTGLQGHGTNVSDAPTTAALMSCRPANNERWKPAYLRGIWDLCVNEGGLWQPTPAWTSRYAAFLGELIQKGWGWIGTNTSTSRLISAIVANANGTVKITTTGNLFPAFPAQYLVRASGIGGATILNGSLQVNATALNEFDTVQRIPIFPWTAGGRVRYNTLQFTALANGTILRVVERKPGRVFFRSVGRRKGRQLA